MKTTTDSNSVNLVADFTRAICTAHPNTQAIYLYGTWGTEYQRKDSDIDLGILLPHDEAQRANRWDWIPLATEVAGIVRVEWADLINLRHVSVVLCKEIVFADRRIYCADQHAADEFEMLTLSFYQQFNADRREIMESCLRSGRFYDV